MFTVATYNILHGYYSELILQNIKLLINQGTDVFCLQEAEVEFSSFLDKFLKNLENGNWQVEYYNPAPACNLAIVWNADRLQFKSAKGILLPTLVRPSTIQRFIKFRNAVLQRGAFTASFLVEKKTIQITTAHLAWEGGLRHRLVQLDHLRDELDKNRSDCSILAGDFNTLSLLSSARNQTREVEKLLGSDYINVFPDLAWTCDTSYTAPNDGFAPLVKFCHLLGLRIQLRLDYIFSRNLDMISAEMLDLPGSDHRPLVARFNI